MTSQESTQSRSSLWAPRHWPGWLGFGLLRLASTLPFGTQLALGRVLGRTLGHLSPRHRRIARTNVRLCFGELSEAQREALLRAHFEALGISLFEVGLSWWGSERRLRPLISTQGLEHLEGALARGCGVILLAAHFTTLEISGRLLTLLRPIDVTYREGGEDPMGAQLRVQRQKLYERAIPKGDVRTMVRRLKAGKIVWFAPDQAFGGKNRVYADFFGVAAATNPATARLAAMTGAAVVPFLARRRADGGGYELIFQPALKGFPGADIEHDARRVNEVFEQLVRLAPEQYFWVHKRFKHPPAGQPEVY